MLYNLNSTNHSYLNGGRGRIIQRILNHYGIEFDVEYYPLRLRVSGNLPLAIASALEADEIRVDEAEFLQSLISKELKVREFYIDPNIFDVRRLQSELQSNGYSMTVEDVQSAVYDWLIDWLENDLAPHPDEWVWVKERIGNSRVFEKHLPQPWQDE